MNKLKSVEFKDEKLFILNQTLLPLKEEYIITDDVERIAVSIERLEVRGAPAIGVTAAYAFALAFKNTRISNSEIFDRTFNRLKNTRPTAVNLFWALEKMKKLYLANSESENLYSILLEEAKRIHAEDIALCGAIGENGLQIFKKKSTVLTHCNTGALAAGGGGTAFSVIKKGFENGLVKHVYADETRPLLQGSRLTAFELEKAGIPFSVNTDSTAALLMAEGKIDLVITGADRIAANGDSANKIGTYNLAVLCNYHKIPFYIAAPYTTIDKSCPAGKSIQIELRSGKEISSIKGIQITKDNYDFYSPAFDVTPNELITGIITEKQIYSPPYNFHE